MKGHCQMNLALKSIQLWKVVETSIHFKTLLAAEVNLPKFRTGGESYHFNIMRADMRETNILLEARVDFDGSHTMINPQAIICNSKVGCAKQLVAVNSDSQLQLRLDLNHTSNMSLHLELLPKGEEAAFSSKVYVIVLLGANSVRIDVCWMFSRCFGAVALLEA